MFFLQFSGLCETQIYSQTSIQSNFLFPIELRALNLRNTCHFAVEENLVVLCVCVCVCTAALPKVPRRREDLCQFVITHKLPSFMKYQITNWPSVRFPAWKWDCNIGTSIRITERATLSPSPAELASLRHFTARRRHARTTQNDNEGQTQTFSLCS